MTSEYIVLVKDSEIFEQKYRTGTNTLGPVAKRRRCELVRILSRTSLMPIPLPHRLTSRLQHHSQLP